MKNWTNNQKALFNELSAGYELDDLRKVATVVGVAHSDLKAQGAKRTSTRSAAEALAGRAAPDRVRKVLLALGFDLSDMPWDDYETSPSTQWEEEGAGTPEGDGKPDSGDADAEASAGPAGGEYPSEIEGEFTSEMEDGEAELQEDISRYFGGGQIEVLQKISEKAGKSGGGSQIKVTLPELPEPREFEGVAPDVFEEVLDFAALRKPILLVGPTGCGKTHLAGIVAKALNMHFASISCTEGMSESNLQGWLLPLGDAGKFVYVPATFIKFYEEGGVYLLDEIDASDPNVLLLINTALANDHIHIPQRHENPIAKKHKDFVCIAAANTYGNGATMQFVGRNQLDAATLDRFKAATVTMDYDPVIEKQIIHADVLAWGKTLRERMVSSNVEQFLSTRFMRDLTDMYQLRPQKYGQKFWEQQLTQGWSQDEISRVVY